MKKLEKPNATNISAAVELYVSEGNRDYNCSVCGKPITYEEWLEHDHQCHECDTDYR